MTTQSIVTLVIKFFFLLLISIVCKWLKEVSCFFFSKLNKYQNAASVVLLKKRVVTTPPETIGKLQL